MYSVYLKSSHKAFLRQANYDEEEQEEAKSLLEHNLKSLATVSVANYHATELNQTYRFSFCKQCEEVQPPRTYHCDACAKCVLRMDHHCPWMGTCIGLLNYKFYWQFLLYGTLSQLIIVLTVLISDGITLLAAFAIFLLIDFGILLGVQTKRVLENKTATDGAYLVGAQNIYRDKDWVDNWQQVFTTNMVSWLLPFGSPNIT